MKLKSLGFLSAFSSNVTRKVNIDKEPLHGIQALCWSVAYVSFGIFGQHWKPSLYPQANIHASARFREMLISDDEVR